MKEERRASGRVRLAMKVLWAGEQEEGVSVGSVHDLNVNGCFVMASGKVRVGEGIRLEFPVPDGEGVTFRGEVVNHLEEIGFGIKFIEMDEPAREFITRLMEQATAKGKS